MTSRLVAMIAKFLDHNNRSKDDGDGIENNKTTNLHVHHAFCTFLSRRYTTATGNFLISRARLYVVE